MTSGSLLQRRGEGDRMEASGQNFVTTATNGGSGQQIDVTRKPRASTTANHRLGLAALSLQLPRGDRKGINPRKRGRSQWVSTTGSQRPDHKRETNWE